MSSPPTPEGISVSVIVPIYNEIDLLGTAIPEISRFLCESGIEHEIIIIESGSTDGSAGICDQLGATVPHVRVIHEGQRNGMGAALRLGYDAARLNLVWLVTADIPFPLETLSHALPLMRRYDCVLSYRSEDQRGLFRKLQSLGYNQLVKAALGLPMKTVNSAFKLFRREVLQQMELTSTGWFLDAEVLYWVVRRAHTFTEIPVPLVDRSAGSSKVRRTDILATLWELVQFKQKTALKSPNVWHHND